jgi:hypothetical protein
MYILTIRSAILCWFLYGGFTMNLIFEILVVLLNLEGKKLFLAFCS